MRDVVLDLQRATAIALRVRVVRAVLRVPLPALRHGGVPGHRARAAPGARALARARARRCRPGATSRYVDSSVERMQVKVRHMTGDRYVVTCNGRPVPLAPTGTHGEYVAGVRYRAWQPPSALHPTIARACAAGVRSRRPVERPLARRLHLPRRRIRAGAATSAFRSTPTKPRRGAWRASPRTATPPVRCRCGPSGPAPVPAHARSAPRARLRGRERAVARARSSRGNSSSSESHAGSRAGRLSCAGAWLDAPAALVIGSRQSLSSSESSTPMRKFLCHAGKRMPDRSVPRRSPARPIRHPSW